MSKRVALMAGVGLGAGFLGACSDSPLEPTAAPAAFVPKTSFVVGAVTDGPAPIAVTGKIIVCKTGNAGGSFSFTRSTEGPAVDPTGSVAANQTIATGKCLEVANDNSPSGSGSHIRITEAAAANTVQTITACSFRGYQLDGVTLNPPENCTYLNGGDLFLNHFHGFVITYNNTFTPPPPPPAGCTFTQGYYKNHENVVVKLLGTNGGYVVGGKLVVSADGNTAYTAAQIDAIFGTPPKGGNAELILLHQLMTAELNVKGGASTPAGVLAAINGARTLMNGGISSSEAAAAKAFADTLDAYNNGVTGPGHCD